MVPRLYQPISKGKPEDGTLRYWHFNRIPEIELDFSDVLVVNYQQRYFMCVGQAPCCMDVLPYEEKTKFVQRVAPLWDVRTDDKRLGAHYEAWWNDEVNREWLPHDERYRKKIARDHNRAWDYQGALPPAVESNGFSAAAGIPRRFSPEPLGNERHHSNPGQAAKDPVIIRDESDCDEDGPEPQKKTSNARSKAPVRDEPKDGTEGSDFWPGVPDDHVWVVNGRLQCPEVWLTKFKNPYDNGVNRGNRQGRYQHVRSLAPNDRHVLPYETRLQYAERVAELGVQHAEAHHTYVCFLRDPTYMEIFPRDAEGIAARQSITARKRPNK